MNEPDWAKELGPLELGDIELMEDAINALARGANTLAKDHALHGLRRRVAAAREMLDAGATARSLTDEQIYEIWCGDGKPAPIQPPSYIWKFARALETHIIGAAPSDGGQP